MLTVRYCPRCGRIEPDCGHAEIAEVPLAIARQARLGFFRGQHCGVSWDYWTKPLPEVEEAAK